MRTIHKYPFAIADRQILEVPNDWVFRHLGLQAGYGGLLQPYLWLQVDSTARMARLPLLVVGTGHEVPDYRCFLGTLMMEPFVWHVYEGVLTLEDER